MRDKNLGWRLALLLTAGFALTTAFTISSIAGGPVAPQDAVRLENRINQLEQRLYTMENSIRNLDQQTRAGSLNSRNVSAEDVALLRAEVQRLSLRLIQDECGLAKLDERTLSRQVRDARRGSGSIGNDPCRQQVDTPLRLPEPR